MPNPARHDPGPPGRLVSAAAHGEEITLKTLLIITLSVGLCANAWGQTAPDQQIRTRPKVGAFVDLAIWTPAQSVAGDLNGDGLADVAVALGQKRTTLATEDDARSRALMILFAAATGR